MFPSYYGSCDNQAAIPTDVSIATSASGDYNNACVIEAPSSGVLDDGSGFAGGRIELELPASGLDNLYDFYAYLRATGADQYRWNLQNFSYSWTNTGDPELDPGDGDGGTGQDKLITGGGPIGCSVTLTSAPSPGDTWSVEIVGSASSGSGPEVSSGLQVTVTYTL